MPDLFLFIPDSPLREAVLEQIKAAKLGEARSLEGAQGLPKLNAPGEAEIFIVEYVSDSKTRALVEALRAARENPVILLLGASEGVEDVTETFATPFRLGHLVVRLRHYIDQAPLLRNAVIAFGPYRLEIQTRCVFRENEPEPIRLTEKETALLVFIAHSKAPATRKEILADVWGYDERIDTHTLETHVYQLRRKLDREGENWLVNDAGAYRLAELKL